MRWQLLGYAFLLVGGESAADCSPPAHMLRAIRDAERVSMLRLSATANGRANPLDTSSFLGFRVLESMELEREGGNRVAHALGQARSYGCADERGETEGSLPTAQIGFEFFSGSERVRLVLLEPEQNVEMELRNGLGARVTMSAAGDRAWWEAMRPLLSPDLERFDFYAFMASPDGALPVLDPFDPGPNTQLELPLVPVTRVWPDYPALARSMAVRVHALVGPDGRVHRAEIIEGFVTLNDAARAAVLQWQFNPPLKDGKIVWAWTSVTVPFLWEDRNPPWGIDRPSTESE